MYLRTSQPDASNRAQGLLLAGGVLADATLANQSPSSIRAAVAAKLTSAQLLQRTAALHPAAQVLLFSSVSALLGSAGQAPYAAANGGLDGLAAAWSRAGTPAASLQWGAWAGAGMATRDATTAARVARHGMGLIPPAVGLAALQSLMGHTKMPAVTLAVPFLWETVSAWGSQGTAIKTLLSEIAAQVEPTQIELPQCDVTASETAAQPAAVQLRVENGQSSEQVLSEVLSAIISLLGESIGADVPLMSAGLDSLGAH